MTLREQFLELVLAHPLPVLPESTEASQKSRVIVEWVRDWITQNALPLNSLPEAVNAVASFKRAIGGKIRVSEKSSGWSVDIDMCPIAAVSRANPHLCLLTCHVFGDIASSSTPEIWVSMEQTWALDDQPCHLEISTAKPRERVVIPYGSPVENPSALASFWNRTREVPAITDSAQLVSLLNDDSQTLEDLFTSLASWISGAIWFEDRQGTVIGRRPSDNKMTLSHPVIWRNQPIGHLFVENKASQIPGFPAFIPVVARLVAMRWAESQLLAINWDESQELLRILFSPFPGHKQEILDRWRNFCQLTSLCPATIVVWYRPNVDPDYVEKINRQFRQYAGTTGPSSVPPVLVGWVQKNWVGVVPQATPKSALEPWSRIIHSIIGEDAGIGLREKVSTLDEFPYAYDEALHSARYAFEHNIVKPLSLSGFPGIRLIPYYQKIPGFRQYCEKLLDILKDEDSRHNTELLSTLKTYVTCHMSVKKTSASLYIHPGTLKYRLRQIRDLTGWDLHDPLCLMEIITSLMVSEQMSWDMADSRELPLWQDT
ncbi:MAG: helix-turn-helix domain-containing protein [Firmicutes bacterium]|nr:helix-turn-helix domain-containing protein [Bacillota bacterium]